MSSSLTRVCTFNAISSVVFGSSRNNSHSGSSGEGTWGKEGGERGEGGGLRGGREREGRGP